MINIRQHFGTVFKENLEDVRESMFLFSQVIFVQDSQRYFIQDSLERSVEINGQCRSRQAFSNQSWSVDIDAIKPIMSAYSFFSNQDIRMA